MAPDSAELLDKPGSLPDISRPPGGAPDDRSTGKSGIMWLRIVMAIVILAALGGGAAYWYMARQTVAAPDAGGSGAESGGFAMPVEAAPVRLGVVERTIRAVGSLRSDESVIVASEIDGRVAEINVAEGQRIDAGTIIATLDSSIHEAELEQARARLALSEANYARARDLKQTGAGTARALDEAQAELRTDRAAIAVAEARLAKTRISAPFDGVLGMRRVSVGAYLSSGDEIINLEAIDTLKVDFRVPEVFLRAVRIEQQIQIAIDALPNESFTGKVYAIDPLIDAAGRSIVIRATVPNATGALRPGLFARVALIVERREGAMLVPERALVPVGGEQFVFRIVDGAAAMTKVSLGERLEGEVEILDGLSPGDVIVTDGMMKLQDGMPLAVLPAGGAS